jgi:uncharacterized protein
MPDDLLRYDRMVENALRGVVRDALNVALCHGLSGDHHFYITFLTNAAGVQIAPVLKARHPEEMTIVLQHQFWDLNVGEELFEVTLSFSGASQRLRIPFAAVTGFADPSVKFGLQFQAIEMDDDDDDEVEVETVAEEKAAPAAIEETGKVIALDAFRKK